MRSTLVPFALLAGCFGTTEPNPDWPPVKDASTTDAGEAGTDSDASCEDCMSLDASMHDASTKKCNGPKDCTGVLSHCGPAGTCVECMMNEHCPVTDPVCSENACVGCASPGDCNARTGMLACDTASGDCVECTVGNEIACTSQGKVCSSDGGSCVECNTNTDCPGGMPHCSEQHVCEPCSENSDCAGWKDGQRVLGLCVAGACEECTVSNEAPCATASCNPKTLRCTDTPRASRNVCQTCDADSECKANHLCVNTLFKGVPQGGHCLKLDDDSCTRPFASGITRESLSAPTTANSFCGFPEEITSCEAILGLFVNGDLCPSGADSECSQPGGICRKVGTQNNNCTYSCGGPSQCPTGYPCGSFNDNIGYCGGQP